MGTDRTCGGGVGRGCCVSGGADIHPPEASPDDPRPAYTCGLVESHRARLTPPGRYGSRIPSQLIHKPPTYGPLLLKLARQNPARLTLARLPVTPARWLTMTLRQIADNGPTTADLADSLPADTAHGRADEAEGWGRERSMEAAGGWGDIRHQYPGCSTPGPGWPDSGHLRHEEQTITRAGSWAGLRHD